MKHQIKQAVLRAFSRLKRDDGSLFDCKIEEEFGYDSRKLHEVCINHKLAIYLGNEILPINSGADQKYFVDIEFNREGINKKKIIVCKGKELVVRPDIIIHNRKSGKQKKNFLIVECKMKGAQHSEIEYDEKKIRAFMENDKYKYSFGLQVVYGKGEIKGTLFYKNGQAIEREAIISS
jgi:hypothetical protein